MRKIKPKEIVINGEVFYVGAIVPERPVKSLPFCEFLGWEGEITEGFKLNHKALEKIFGRKAIFSIKESKERNHAE